MKYLKENSMEVFLLASVLIVIVILFTNRDLINTDIYIQSMAQIAVIAALLLPQFIRSTKSKNLS